MLFCFFGIGYISDFRGHRTIKVLIFYQVLLNPFKSLIKLYLEPLIRQFTCQKKKSSKCTFNKILVPLWRQAIRLFKYSKSHTQAKLLTKKLNNVWCQPSRGSLIYQEPLNLLALPGTIFDRSALQCFTHDIFA